MVEKDNNTGEVNFHYGNLTFKISNMVGKTVAFAKDFIWGCSQIGMAKDVITKICTMQIRDEMKDHILKSGPGLLTEETDRGLVMTECYLLVVDDGYVLGETDIKIMFEAK